MGLAITIVPMYDFGATDVDEVGRGFACHRPCGHGLPAPRRAEEQHPFGGIDAQALEELPRLEKLHVHSKAPITDAGLESLKKHRRLFELRVGGPHITEEGLEGLKAALPNCNVIYDPAVEVPEG